MGRFTFLVSCVSKDGSKVLEVNSGISKVRVVYVQLKHL